MTNDPTHQDQPPRLQAVRSGHHSQRYTILRDDGQMVARIYDVAGEDTDALAQARHALRDAGVGF